MFRGNLHVLAGVALIASLATATAAAASVEAGHYHGRTTADASGKPRAIAFTVKTTGCGTAAYCVAVDRESYIQGKCATSGYMYNAFFPITAPIALPASGKLDHTYTLYVGGNGAIRAAPGGGGVPSGRFQLSLVFDAQGRVTGSERVSVDLHEGDGVCDTGVVKITASR
jgi:hypothetical protein